MRRGLIRGIGVILVVIVVAFIAQRLFGDDVVLGTVWVPEPVATIGSGEDAIGVAADGEVVPWWPLGDGPALPELALTEVPKGKRLRGPAREQARVLGAAPRALRPHVARSFYGEEGVAVETTSGIELRFGDASQAKKKWKAAAAVLADPEIEAVDYVNVTAPSRPAISGSGHALPPVP